MREILFRAKRLDNGEWVEGYFVKKIDPLFKTEICFILIQEYDKSCIDGTPTVLKSEMTWYRVIPETVGQYTGLTDKNGKKIFEGDILRLDYIGVNAFVAFDKEKFGVLRGWHKKFVPLDVLANATLEVIGNIHDKPELLEE